MTFAEFLAVVEEYDLPVEDPEKFRFLIKDMSLAEFRAYLEREQDSSKVWEYGDEPDIMLDGDGNRWLRPHNRDGD
jgi:hypothetical protein